MPPTAAAPSLLDLLHEAGDEAVTLGELEVAGVADPARELWELEMAGMKVQRVYEHPSRVMCVRLSDEPDLVPPPVREPAPATATPPRGVVLAVAALLVLLLAAFRRR